MSTLSWRPLSGPDLPAVTELARLCLSADGGQPFAADPAFLGGWYASGAPTRSGWDGKRLVCVSALGLEPRDQAGGRHVAITTGLVHPCGGAAESAGTRSTGSGRMRSAGAPTITLNVNVNNPHAALLYSRVGFAPTGRRARYQG